MSLLRERLQQYKQQLRTNKTEPPLQNQKPEEGGFLDGEMVNTPEGSFVRRRKKYDLDYIHGKYPLRSIFDVSRVLPALMGREQEILPNQLLFLDVESTGLGVGSGNLPFLVGIGYFVADGLIIEQGFIRDPAEEPAMISYFNEILPSFSVLVTFNGKSFDWPVFKNRFVLYRKDLAKDFQLAHLDLLYPARRLWKNSIPSCRLGQIEALRLGYQRQDDLPGHLAPARYFQYLQERDPELMRSVFRHNETDLVSLASLLIYFLHLLSGKGIEGLKPAERYRLALWAEELVGWEDSAPLFYALVHLPDEEIAPFIHDLSLRFKRHGDYPTAVRLWQREIRWNREFRLPAYIELAKYYEHMQKDPMKALEYAEEALYRIWQRRQILKSSRKYEQDYEAILHRIRRLQVKIDQLDQKAR